jgi:copper chaperone CopZ
MKNFLLICLLGGISLSAWAEERRYNLRVDGVACPYCAYGVEKKIKALDGVNKESVEIKINEGLVLFEADTDVPIGEDTLKELINDAGFTLRNLEIDRPAGNSPGNQ